MYVKQKKSYQRLSRWSCCQCAGRQSFRDPVALMSDFVALTTKKHLGWIAHIWNHFYNSVQRCETTLNTRKLPLLPFTELNNWTAQISQNHVTQFLKPRFARWMRFAFCFFSDRINHRIGRWGGITHIFPFGVQTLVKTDAPLMRTKLLIGGV